MAKICRMEELSSFGFWDYLVLSLMLGGCLIIGVYQAFHGLRDADDYLLGGRQMKVFPVAISLFSSFISAIGILGFCGETYGHGLEASWQLVGAAIGILVISRLITPVLYPLKLTSINQFLGLRFNSTFLQRLAMCLGVVQALLYMGMCLYAPTIALGYVMPMDSNINIIILGIICTVYSTLGGLRAVVWVDVFQIGVMVIGVLTIITVACVDVGGVGQAWIIAEAHNRTNMFNLHFDVYERHNLLNLLLLGLFNDGFNMGLTQASFQRVSSVPTLASAIGVLHFTALSLIVIGGLLFFMGICVFAVYADCSPLGLGLINSKDQILPYFVLDRLTILPGMPGLFVAAIFSGALSSISSALNGVVAMLWKDILQTLPAFAKCSKTTETRINKGLSLLVGMVMIMLAYLSSLLGGILQAFNTLNGVTAGPMVGLFLMAVLLPWVNHYGAAAGLISSWVLMAWVALGSFFYSPSPELLSMSTDGCPHNNTTLGIATPVVVTDQIITPGWMTTNIYGISYCLLQIIGAIICILIGTLVSIATGGMKEINISKDYVHPIIHKWIKSQDVPTNEEMKVLNPL
ncbi:unnamed protein product, partial [Meganyctiphanes norvegica]